jgi:hypothetical protein
MARWPELVATLTLALALPTLGCAGRVVPGLANAPSLNRTAPDDSVHDVVANDEDACSHGGSSPLRGHFPKCEAGPHPVAIRSSLVLPSYKTTEGESLVIPWLRHLYVGRPCASATDTSGSIASLATEPFGASCTP